MSVRIQWIGQWCWLLFVLIVLHAGSIALDPTIRFFMGDSGSYLHAATHDWIPPDRSYLYPLLIRWLVLPFGSLLPLLLLQSAAAIAVAMIGFHVLRRSIGIDAHLAALFALLIGLGPELVFYSRMVMAENFGLMALASMLLVGCTYLRRGNPAWLLVIALLSLIVASLRLSLLPVALGIALMPPIMLTLANDGVDARRWLRGATHVLVVAIAMFAMHSAYKTWYGAASGSTAHDYIQEGGFFRLGLVLPLVQPVDLEGLGLADDFLAQFPDAADSNSREAQMWLPGGIVAVLKEKPGYDQGSRAAAKIAGRALRRDPLGLFRLAAPTLRGYFVANDARARMQEDAGINAVDDGLASMLRDHFDYDGSQVHLVHGLSWHAFVASRLWLTFCLFALAPLALVAIALSWSTPFRVPALFVGLSSMGLAAAEMLFSHIASFRYLVPFPFFIWLCAGIVIGTSFRRRQALSNGTVGATKAAVASTGGRG